MQSRCDLQQEEAASEAISRRRCSMVEGGSGVDDKEEQGSVEEDVRGVTQGDEHTAIQQECEVVVDDEEQAVVSQCIELPRVKSAELVLPSCDPASEQDITMAARRATLASAKATSTIAHQCQLHSPLAALPVLIINTHPPRRITSRPSFAASHRRRGRLKSSPTFLSAIGWQARRVRE